MNNNLSQRIAIIQDKVNKNKKALNLLTSDIEGLRNQYIKKDDRIYFSFLSSLPYVTEINKIKFSDGVYGHRIPIGTNSNDIVLLFVEFDKGAILEVHSHPDSDEEIHVFKNYIKNKLTGEVTDEVHSICKISSGISHKFEAPLGAKMYILFKKN